MIFFVTDNRTLFPQILMVLQLAKIINEIPEFPGFSRSSITHGKKKSLPLFNNLLIRLIFHASNSYPILPKAMNYILKCAARERQNEKALVGIRILSSTQNVRAAVKTSSCSRYACSGSVFCCLSSASVRPLP